MAALFIAASLAFGGFFWGWSLHTGGGGLDPRTAARIFGWLCMASVAAGLFFALRRKTAYDQPSAALAAALATTLLTGTGVLYLSYFQWPNEPDFAAASDRAAMTTAREVAPPPLPMPASLHAAALHSASPAHAVAPKKPLAAPLSKAAAAGKTAGSQSPAKAAEGPCARLEGLAQHQCARCTNESGVFRFVCEENARAEYCAGREGGQPGCPWVRSAATTD